MLTKATISGLHSGITLWSIRHGGNCRRPKIQKGNSLNEMRVCPTRERRTQNKTGTKNGRWLGEATKMEQAKIQGRMTDKRKWPLLITTRRTVPRKETHKPTRTEVT